ncbi:NUDIX hydrolase [Sphingobacterium hungaricum]|uniref:DNA mismatch repair protein MutT n=1 Tax=Sphingobacterium hungaricum TaxID=2082723 RepID=A0A928UU97_9SPHI|nr:NUDIX domain-containing protein [Sphingobacterium hungaricum]MBE8713018.1 DNA mismatch repair protein MutT [Sphingobacterium hungaricum]
MKFYKNEPLILLAVDCIIFGFNGESLQILLIKRGFEPEINHWSLMGGFVQPEESPEEAATRILKKLTGLENLYMEQSSIFGKPDREKYQRVVSITYFALIDTNQYQHILSDEYKAKWFPIDNYPELIFDHEEMIVSAKRLLRSKAAVYPILFELLPEKFTLPQISSLYEAVYTIDIDKRNFNRKLLSSKLLIKLNEKDKENSKKGAFYYTLNRDVYKERIMSFLRYLPSWSIQEQ